MRTNITFLSSLQNPKVKQLLTLQQKSSERRKAGLFVVEGQRELGHCVDAGFELEAVFCCPELCPEAVLDRYSIPYIYHVSPSGMIFQNLIVSMDDAIYIS